MNKLGLATIVCVSVAACGLNEEAVFIALLSNVFWVIAILADSKTVESQPVPGARVLSRYEQVELMSGAGWGSKREELRAHLLGVWTPKGPSAVYEQREAESEQPTSRTDKSYALGLLGLVVAGAGAFHTWSAVVVGLLITALVQYRSTSGWDFVRALPLNGCLVVGCLVLIYGPVMWALAPAIFILGRRT